jgi:hypothetical protein
MGRLPGKDVTTRPQLLRVSEYLMQMARRRGLPCLVLCQDSLVLMIINIEFHHRCRLVRRTGLALPVEASANSAR